MEKLLGKAQALSRVLVWLGGILIILSAFLVTLEVLLRKFANISLGGADELSGYAFGIATSFGMAYALFERAHIRVDALYSLFPERIKSVANIVGISLLAGFVYLICMTSWGLVADTLEHGSRSITPMRTPLAFVQVPWLAGWIYFFFCCVLLLLVATRALLRGDSATANRLIGTKTIDEQIQDESV